MLLTLYINFITLKDSLEDAATMMNVMDLSINK